MGDLNFVLDSSEKVGGNQTSQSVLDKAKDFVDSLGLHGINFSSNPFTWSNKRHDIDLVQERLYRALGNDAWFNFFSIILMFTTWHQ